MDENKDNCTLRYYISKGWIENGSIRLFDTPDNTWTVKVLVNEKGEVNFTDMDTMDNVFSEFVSPLGFKFEFGRIVDWGGLYIPSGVDNPFIKE